MTKDEFSKLLDGIMPQVVGGMVRPTDPIPTDLDFCTDFRQFLAADENWYEQENAFLRQLFSNDKALNILISAIKTQLASCDLRLATQALKGLMSPPDKAKLDGIQAGATNYNHPATHPAAMIILDALHKFVTDAQISTWNAKANANHGQHIPAPQNANNAVFLRNDDTWQYVTPDNIGAYTKGAIDGALGNMNNMIATKEPAFGKGSAFNKNFGTSGGTVCQGDDYRLSNARAPLTHTHDDRYYTETEIYNLLAAKANIASPSFAGVPTAPTPSTADNSNKIATTAFVLALIDTLKANGGLGGTAGESLQGNGWVKFTNGLIIQWGSVQGQKTISYPITFTSLCFGIVTGSTLHGYANAAIDSFTKSTCDIFVESNNTVWWFAIGK